MDIEFNSDGTKLFLGTQMIGDDDTIEMDLLTAYDVSFCKHVEENFDMGGLELEVSNLIMMEKNFLFMMRQSTKGRLNNIH